MKLVNLDTLKNFYDKIKPKIGGGYIYAENYSKDFWAALDEAIYRVEEGGIIDCTSFTGNHTITQNFVINKPCKIIFGNIDVTYNGSSSLFDIQSDNVTIEGLNRNADKTTIGTGASIFRLNSDEAGLMSDNEGYHIYSSGYKNLIIKGLTLVGKQTTLGRQFNNSTYPLDGYGGIYIEKQTPGTTGSGNNVNSIKIENILIDGTRAHGIYLDTPILSNIKDVRISSCAGHGVFINGGTTCTLESVYISSCQLAGFCIYSHTYSTILNCVAENCGCGFWIRSSFNISVFNAGVEDTITYGANPWRLSRPISGKYGFNLLSANGIQVPDVTSDSYGYFIGYGIIISGGKAINFFSPYVTNIGNSKTYEVYTGGTSVSAKIRYLLVTGANSQSMVTNIRQKDTIGTNATNTNDIWIDEEVDSFELVTDPKQGTIYGPGVSLVNSTNIGKAVIMNYSNNSVIRNGDTVYTKTDFKREPYTLTLGVDKYINYPLYYKGNRADSIDANRYCLYVPVEALEEQKINDNTYKLVTFIPRNARIRTTYIMEGEEYPTNALLTKDSAWTPFKLGKNYTDSFPDGNGYWDIGNLNSNPLYFGIEAERIFNYSIGGDINIQRVSRFDKEYYKLILSEFDSDVTGNYIEYLRIQILEHNYVSLNYTNNGLPVPQDAFSSAPKYVLDTYKFRYYNRYRNGRNKRSTRDKVGTGYKIVTPVNIQNLADKTKTYRYPENNLIFGFGIVDNLGKLITNILPVKISITPIMVCPLDPELDYESYLGNELEYVITNISTAYTRIEDRVFTQSFLEK